MGLTSDQRLADAIATFCRDPLGYVMFAFPWDTEESIQKVELAPEYQERFSCKYGPDKWACEFLDDLGEEIKKRNFTGKSAVPPIRFSTASGHGIGKSTLVAWLIMFLLDCYPFSMGVVTATTSDQLRTKTWAELAKWYSLSITKHLYTYNNSRGSMAIYRNGPDDIKQKWRCDAMTCREENADAFQGLHSADSVPYYIFDEASGVPDSIWEARLGGATDGMPMSFDFGNPTKKSGFFFENTVGRFSARFNTRSIDSRDVAITGKHYIEELKEDWGEDSDVFKVRVRGVFPSAGSVQFINSDDVDDAMLRAVEVVDRAPLVIGVDVARFGDNNTVLYPRIGHDARSWPYKQYSGLSIDQTVDRIIEMIQEFERIGKKVSAVNIDGGGLGSGVVDYVRRLGYSCNDIRFDGKATDRRWHRKADEMWGRMRDDLRFLCLPRNEDLKAQLTQREYGFLGDRIKLEPKSDMEDRGLQSPDIADALALTYAVPSPHEDTGALMVPETAKDWNPLESKW